MDRGTKSVLEEALPLARAVHNRWLVGYLLRLSGHACALDGDLGSARGYIAEALQHYKAVGAKLDIGWTMETLSWVDFRAGDAEPALRDTTEALATFRKFGTCAASRLFSTIWRGTRLVDTIRRGREERTRSTLHGTRARLGRPRCLCPTAPRSDRSVTTPKRSRPQAYRLRTGCAILGFVDARLAAMGSARAEEQQEYDRVLNVLGDAVGADALGKLMAAGAAMTEEQAVEASNLAVPFPDSHACEGGG